MKILDMDEVIREGDEVIVFLSSKMKYLQTMKKGDVSQTKYGALFHDKVIGMKYGSKIVCSKGFVHILALTPEEWIEVLPHRTQILYSTDISLICFELDLLPGHVVFEAGSGSGCLSHSILKCIYPNGHLYTFEKDVHRVEVLRKEFESHELAQCVTVSNRDVIQNGFLDKNIPHNDATSIPSESSADAVFLDLPAPWQTIEAAYSVLKKSGGRFASFSPCIEQVQRTCEELKRMYFQEIETIECILQPYKLSHMNSESLEPKSSSNFISQQYKKFRPELKCEETSSPSLSSNFPKVENKRTSVLTKESKIVGHTGYLTFAILLS